MFFNKRKYKYKAICKNTGSIYSSEDLYGLKMYLRVLGISKRNYKIIKEKI